MSASYWLWEVMVIQCSIQCLQTYFPVFLDHLLRFCGHNILCNVVWEIFLILNSIFFLAEIHICGTNTGSRRRVFTWYLLRIWIGSLDSPRLRHRLVHWRFSLSNCSLLVHSCDRWFTCKTRHQEAITEICLSTLTVLLPITSFFTCSVH